MTYADLRRAIDDAIDRQRCWLDFPELYGSDFEENADQIAQNLECACQLRGEAEDLIRAGLPHDAKRRLECFLFPKWRDVESCQDAHREAMNR